ncbi:MAG: hypothetical protein JW816_00410 [Candidatus Buchananbacteria bacterium]|nr:hypothetical protein [Candidatus Buchananbacteria bacterium]
MTQRNALWDSFSYFPRCKRTDANFKTRKFLARFWHQLVLIFRIYVSYLFNRLSGFNGDSISPEQTISSSFVMTNANIGNDDETSLGEQVVGGHIITTQSGFEFPDDRCSFAGGQFIGELIQVGGTQSTKWNVLANDPPKRARSLSTIVLGRFVHQSRDHSYIIFLVFLQTDLVKGSSDDCLEVQIWIGQKPHNTQNSSSQSGFDFSTLHFGYYPLLR